MGFYRDHVLPRIWDVACDVRAGWPLRERVCAGLRGEVVEIGFGSGLNVPFYPPTVTRVAAIEPSDVSWRLARHRIAASSVPVRLAGPDGQSLPFPDDSFDSILSTWVMCTVPDLAVALAELRRVLRPGGTVHFVEHGLAPDPRVQRWQHRLDPFQARFVGGCHLNRPIVRWIEAGGFLITELDVFYQRGGPKWLTAESLGTAVKLGQTKGGQPTATASPTATGPAETTSA